MRPFHLVVRDNAADDPRRIEFMAESPDQAFMVARNESDGSHVELWDGSKLLANMTKSGANIWKLLPISQPTEAGVPDIEVKPVSPS